ncbi:MAG: hypothetical protein J6V76_07855 [Bacteroidales bacterium]|nr:hypothetical protein [Bacteroidales bacterium]MBO7143007.1 hypothetical protein [Bacteroidales bacterium]
MKRLLIPSALLAAMLSFPGFAQAQDPDMFDLLSHFQLTDEQNSSLLKLQDDITKGEKFVAQAESQDKANAKFLNSSKKGKLKKGEKKSAEAKSLRIKATKLYEKSYTSLYDIYKQVIEGSEFIYQSDKSQADSYLSDAENDLQDGSAKLSPYGKLTAKSLETKTYSTLKSDMASCKSKFQSAGDNCYSALKLLYTQEERKNQEAAAEQSFWNSTVSVNTIDAYKKYISKYPNGKYVSEAQRRIANLQNAGRQRRVTSDNPDEGLAYRIQICADKRKWSPRKLQRLYKGNLKIDERQSDGFYKYWIGCYRSYEEAQQAEMGMNLKQSFIVCFNDGQQIHVTEAQQIEANLID